MNPQETQQVVVHDEKWVPFSERQFWYTIKKVQGTDSYEFLLANKKCVVDVDVFRMILDICPRVEGVDFTNVPDDKLHSFFSISLVTKTTSNDKLCKSRINILWGMFYRENVDYPELIWEDLAFYIDHRKEKKSRCENMTYPRFTKIIINHFHKQHKSLSNLRYQHYHTIKDDGIVSRLKFIRIGEDYQEYGLSIPDIPPKKSKGKGSQGKKTTYTLVTDVDVSEEPEPEPARKKTSSKRRVKKKVTHFADDNIISDDPDTALELSKSVSLTEAEEAEAARKVHATHVRIVTESVPKPTRRRPSEEQEVADIMKALKESRMSNRRQPGTGGSNERTSSKPGVPNESTVISATLSEGNSAKPRVPDEEKDIFEEKDDKDEDADDEGDDHISDTQDADDEDAKTESKPKTVEHEKKEKEEMTDAAKPDVEKSAKEEGDAEKADGYSFPVKEAIEFPLPPSSLSVSSGFGTQFFNSSSDISLTGELKDATEADVHVLVILETINLSPIDEILTETPVCTDVSSPQVMPIISTMQPTTTPIPTPPSTTNAPTITIIKIDLSIEAFAVLKTQVPFVVDNYLGSKVGDKQTPTVDLEQESKKSPSEILKIKKEQAEKQKMPQFTIKSTNKVALEEHNHKRKHDDDEDDNDEDPLAGPNQGKKKKRRRTKESESSKKQSTTKETPKGKAPSKGSKIGKSTLAKEPVEEPIAEVVMDDAGDDVVRDDDQPQDAYEPKTSKTPNLEWFTQPPRPPTPNPEWNKRQVITKTKAARYKIKGIEDMVPRLSSPTKVRSQLNKFSKHNMYSIKKITGVKSVSVQKLHGYGYLEEIVVKRADRQFYTFKEGDFCGSLYVHKKSVTEKRVEDQQLVMRADELYKFSDGTLKKVRDELHHRILDFCLEYNKEMPRRKWTAIDKRSLELMVELIDKQMRERRIIWNLEILVGARELEMDYKLMTRTT
ncbi:hypothetical protein Tco_0970052 [Tanacetum coccineum]